MLVGGKRMDRCNNLDKGKDGQEPSDSTCIKNFDSSSFLFEII